MYMYRKVPSLISDVESYCVSLRSSFNNIMGYFRERKMRSQILKNMLAISPIQCIFNIRQ